MAPDFQPPPVFDPAWTGGGWRFRYSSVGVQQNTAQLILDGNTHRIALWVSASTMTPGLWGFGQYVSATDGIYLPSSNGVLVIELNWSNHGGAVQQQIWVQNNDIITVQYNITEILWLPSGA